MNITILVDDKSSWFVPYAQLLKEIFKSFGEDAEIAYKQEDVHSGDICFLLSCTKVVTKLFMEKNRHNIVVHASDLPRGKGFSPLSWQVMEGQNEIILTLFEINEKVDAGPYYIKRSLYFDGTELINELRRKMAGEIISMCLKYVNEEEALKPIEQKGEETFYRKLTLDDNRLAINDTLAKQFNKLRVADNERYPAWFSYRGREYIIKIYAREENNSNS